MYVHRVYVYIEGIYRLLRCTHLQIRCSGTYERWMCAPHNTFDMNECFVSNLNFYFSSWISFLKCVRRILSSTLNRAHSTFSKINSKHCVGIPLKEIPMHNCTLYSVLYEHRTVRHNLIQFLSCSRAFSQPFSVSLDSEWLSRRCIVKLCNWICNKVFVYDFYFHLE